MRLAGARDRVRPDLVRVERKPELLELNERRGNVGDAGDDEVLLPRHADVAAEALDEVRNGDQLVAGAEAEPDGNADVRVAVLLRVHADVRGGLHIDRRQLVALERAAEL